MNRAVSIGLAVLLVPSLSFPLTTMTSEEIARMDEELKAKYNQELDQVKMKLSSDRSRLWETRATPLVADEKEVTAKEPASFQDLLDDMSGTIPGAELFWPKDEDKSKYTVPGTPVKRFTTWTLRKEDFITLPPVETELHLAFGPARRYFILPYAITNSSGQEITLYPRLWLKTDKGRLSQEVGGFIIRDQVSASILEKVATTQEFITKLNVEADLASVGALAPGETRWGAAVFPPLDPEMDEMTVVVEGISNSYNFMKMYRPVLCIDYTRYGDEFEVHTDPFMFAMKEWRRQWMWWAETRIGRPEKLDITGPAGESKHSIWVFDLVLKNSFSEDRSLALKNVAILLGVTDPAAAGRPIKVLDDIPIVVRVCDDGDSSVFKVDAFQQASRLVEVPRFINGLIEKEREVTIPIAIEETDVDWDDVYKQVLAAITPSSAAVHEALFVRAVEKGETQKIRELLAYGLDEATRERVRKEVLDQIPAAIQDAFEARRFTIELTGDTNLATGAYRVVRDFIRRTPIDPKLIKTWGTR